MILCFLFSHFDKKTEVFEFGDGESSLTSSEVASKYEGDTGDCSIPTQ